MMLDQKNSVMCRRRIAVVPTTEWRIIFPATRPARLRPAVWSVYNDLSIKTSPWYVWVHCKIHKIPAREYYALGSSPHPKTRFLPFQLYLGSRAHSNGLLWIASQVSQPLQACLTAIWGPPEHS